MGNNSKWTEKKICAELVVDDKKIIRHTPNILKESYRAPFTSTDFLRRLTEGLATGNQPEDWLLELLNLNQVAAARKLLRTLTTQELSRVGIDINIIREKSNEQKQRITKELDRFKDRVISQRGVLAPQIIDDLNAMINDTHKLVSSEWFSLAHLSLEEIRRILDLELAEAMDERCMRYKSAQEMISPLIEKYIFSESVVRLENTEDILWEMISYALRLSVDTAGNLELVKDVGQAIDQLYQGAAPNYALLNRLRDQYGRAQKSKPMDFMPISDDSLDLDKFLTNPLLPEERDLLNRISQLPASLLHIDITKARNLTNLAWNEDEANNLLYKAQFGKLSSEIKTSSEDDKLQDLLSIIRYQLRYWSKRKKVKNFERTEKAIRQVLAIYAELKAIRLLDAQQWDAACEYYRLAFRMRILSENFLSIETFHVHNYFFAYASHKKNAASNAGFDRVKYKSAERLFANTLENALLNGDDKSGYNIIMGMLKLLGEVPESLIIILKSLEYLVDKPLLAETIMSALSKFEALLDCETSAEDIPTRLKRLVEIYTQTLSDQENWLTQLLANTDSSRNIRKNANILPRLCSSKNLWDMTNTYLLERFYEISIELKNYFTPGLPLKEREEIAKQIVENKIPEVLRRIEAAPTAVGSLYIKNALNNIESILDEELIALHQVSIPNLRVFSEQSEWRSDGNYYCHLHIENIGETYAENVCIDIDESPIGEYQVKEERLVLGNIYPDKPFSTHARILPTPLDTEQSEISLVIRLRYLVPGQEGQEERLLRLRVDDYTQERPKFEFIMNPYVVGGPLRSEKMFYGRDRLMAALLQEVANPNRSGSVVIFGQRRSGKTSILYQLARDVPEFIIPIDFDIPSVLATLPKVSVETVSEGAREKALGRFFLALAQGIVKESEKKGLEITSVTWEDIMEKPGPDFQFREFLEQFRNRDDGFRLLLLLDEFTALIDKIDENIIDDGIVRLFKSLIERGYFSCIISGLTEVYGAVKRFANQLAVSKPHLVDYLDKSSAARLISEPITLPNNHSRFNSPTIIDEIIDLTAGSPFYIQLFCYRLVQYMNEMEISRITNADIPVVVNRLLRGPERIDPVQQFDNLYKYKDDLSDSRSAILEGLVIYLLAHETISKPYATVPNMYQHVEHFVSEDEFNETLASLEQRGTVIQQTNETIRKQRKKQPLRSRHYRIRVDLFRQWLVANRPIDEDMLRSFERKLRK
jgi:hypothetical protein